MFSQEALTKSNEIFETYKQEMEKVFGVIYETFHKGASWEVHAYHFGLKYCCYGSDWIEMIVTVIYILVQCYIL
jgi:hypothetical protein